MSRIARQCYEAKFFHIMVQGWRKEKIFEEIQFKEKYLSLMLNISEKANVVILAYCIMDNHTHILIYVDKNEYLTKFMQKINTSFAIYYNKKKDRCGYVFRDRYRCQVILTQAHLETCIRYIHNNPVDAGICKNMSDYDFSTYNQYINKDGIINDEVIKLCFHNVEDYKIRLNYTEFSKDFIDVDNEFGYKKWDDCEDVLKEIMKRESIKLEDINDLKKVEIAKEILKRCRITKKKVAELLRIERSKLTRLMKN